MAEPYIAEIRMWGGNFAPRGWVFCNGQLESIAQNTAVFSLVGTIYGGDGRTTYGIPALASRSPMGPRTGPGLTPRQIGQPTGAPTCKLITSEIPSHNHRVESDERFGEVATPGNNYLDVGRGGILPYKTGSHNTSLSSQALTDFGFGQAHENRQPFLAVSFIFAMQGLYPSRS